MDTTPCQILERLRDESMRLSRSSLDNGCAGCGVNANLADDAAATIERITRELAEAKEAAIAAYRQSLEDAGMVVVPRVPTEEMAEAHFAAHAKASTIFASVPEVWAAMLSAAPPADAK